LSFLPGRGLRPTPDRVRETLFNWLRNDLAGAHCLDLFAGSGALGLEAVSRGASALVAVERHRVSAQRLRENAALLKEDDRVTVIQQDVVRYLSTEPTRPFDIVFADPPFAGDCLGPVCERLASPGWLSDGALVYLEQGADRPWAECPTGWRVEREGRAGQSAQRLLRCSTNA
jgi:16S rRNA (guanine966-N2)-methyltransferase